MKIQVNSDKNVQMDARVMGFVRAEANHALQRFKSKLTRVEFHLSDVNSHKFGRLDKRCLIEVRPAGHRPLAIRVASPNVRAAVLSALSKMRTALDTFFGKLEARHAIARRPQLRLALVHSNSRKPAAKKKAAARAKVAKRAAARKIAAKKTMAKRAIAKKTVARKVARKRVQAAAIRSKKKAIYQARRKSWPARRAA